MKYYNAESFGFSPEGLPESILAIPVTLYLIPVTWFYGVKLVVPSIDKTLYDDLSTIYAAYSKIYGPFKEEWRGKVTAKIVVENKMPESRFDNIVFFSGGVDALHACLLYTSGLDYQSEGNDNLRSSYSGLFLFPEQGMERI